VWPFSFRPSLLHDNPDCSAFVPSMLTLNRFFPWSFFPAPSSVSNRLNSVSWHLTLSVFYPPNLTIGSSISIPGVESKDPTKSTNNTGLDLDATGLRGVHLLWHVFMMGAVWEMYLRWIVYRIVLLDGPQEVNVHCSQNYSFALMAPEFAGVQLCRGPVFRRNDAWPEHLRACAYLSL
jgi:hypothetical protein